MSAGAAPSADHDSAYGVLVRELEHAARLHAEREADPSLAAGLEQLGVWQARRLRATYADLDAQERYRAAIRFFQSDLYGGGDFARRDADFARVASTMARLMPEGVITALAEAAELNTLSQELDRALLAGLPSRDGRPSVADYCEAYRRTGSRLGRERQIELIGIIGHALDRLVGSALVRAALTMMRRPARLAGVGVLHDFLERGFAAFHRMHGAGEFLATIDARERTLMGAILDGATAPFPDPLSRDDGAYAAVEAAGGATGSSAARPGER